MASVVNLPAGIDRPFSIGEIIDRSVTLAVRRWRTIAILVLVEGIPIGIARTLVPDHPAALSLIWFVPDVLLVALLYGAMTRTVASAEAPSAAAALRASASRFGTVLAVILLGWAYLGLMMVPVLIFAVFVVILTVSIAGQGVAVGVAAAFVALGFLALMPGAGLVATIAVPIAALEGASPFRAFGIAFRRARSAGWWRTWLLGLVLFVISLAPALVVGAVASALIELTKIRALNLVDEVVVDAITLGFGMVVATVIALEMRVRYEGSDFEAAALHANESGRLG